MSTTITITITLLFSYSPTSLYHTSYYSTTPVLPTVLPQLQLRTWDINETLSLCIQKGDYYEAKKWFFTMTEGLRLAPDDLTLSLVLSVAASDKM